MDNNNFEQQFAKNVQQSVANTTPNTQSVINSPTPTGTANDTPPNTPVSKLPWIIIAGLSLIVIAQTIILIITLFNSTSKISSEEDDTDETIVTIDEPGFVYDSDENLVAFELTCTNNDASFVFTTDNKYTSPSGSSGTYSVINNNIISLDGNTEHTLYYDSSIAVIDGATFYYCEAPNTTNTE
ncbi:hypothetical protein IJI91_01080 [Candidatus Saccharibacteria bacterium]|nr:hypothetical protein [Candidatus Saccharibacteria bacterium]